MIRSLAALLMLLVAVVLVYSTVGDSGEGVDSIRFEEEVMPLALSHDRSPIRSAALRSPDFGALGQREPVAVETGPVKEKIYRGELRVGDPLDFTRFRGAGRLRLKLGDAEAERVVEVVGGGFEFLSSSHGPISLASVELSDFESVLLLSGGGLSADVENHIYFSWGRRDVQVSVKSRGTGAHLHSVDVWRVAAAERKRTDADFGGKLKLGPANNDKQVLESAKSPFTLRIEPKSLGQFWFVAEGATPFQYRFPEGLPRQTITVHLELEGVVQVWVEGLIGDSEAYRVRLYRGRGEMKYPESLDPLGEYAVESPTVVRALAPGYYTVSLEIVSEAFPRGLVVASTTVEAKTGESQIVRLSARAVERVLSPGEVTFRFPEDSGEPGTPGQVRIVPVSINARRTTTQSGLGPVPSPVSGEWGPIRLIAGEYYLVRAPDMITHHFLVEPESSARYSLPSYDLHPVFLTILDSRTQELIKPLSVSMSTSMTWDGDFDRQHPHEVRSFRGGTSPTQMAAPLGKTQICIQTAERGLEVLDVEIHSGQDPVVELDPSARLGIRLENLGDHVTLRWLSLTQYSLNGQGVEPGSKQVGGSGGVMNLGLLSFHDAGELSLTFPPLPSSGTPKPITVAIKHGELTWVTIDPDCLWE